MTRVPGDLVPVPVGLLDESPDRLPEINMHLSDKARWALVDEDIACIQDQGSTEFWDSFMKGVQNAPNE